MISKVRNIKNLGSLLRFMYQENTSPEVVCTRTCGYKRL